jgi:hypothetical protein
LDLHLGFGHPEKVRLLLNRFWTHNFMKNPKLHFINRLMAIVNWLVALDCWKPSFCNLSIDWPFCYGMENRLMTVPGWKINWAIDWLVTSDLENRLMKCSLRKNVILMPNWLLNYMSMISNQ